jgi:ABC-2 type transport system ATP-binding protein
MAVQHSPQSAAGDVAPQPIAADAPHLALQAEGLTRAYGDVRALDGVDLRLGAGEVLGLLGPNGAGKTTAIRVLTTILAPTAGRFTVAGIPHTRPAEIRRRIGVLPESAGYPESQTGDEFLRFHARLYGRSRTDARAAATASLAAVGLADRASSPIARYSRGMRQRLGIARALINDPAVVFLDEPTLGLDPSGQEQVLRLVGQIARERGAGVVLCTHVLDEVERACSRVLILNRGRTVAEGTVAEVVRRAAARRRARFRVPAERRDDALVVLAALPEVSDAQPLDGRPDWVTVALAEPPQGAPPGAARVDGAARALADAGIALLAFELEGGRLSDAFLAMVDDGD